MSQKAELPSLTGHRTKTRKRDEKKVYDPSGFRDSVIEGLEASRDDEDLEAAADLDAISKWLDIAGNKLDYRRNCIFMDGIDLPRIKQWDNVVIKLMRRYKYLEKMLSEEMKKILVYLRGFTEEHRQRLAQITAIWLCSGLVVPNVIVVVINEHQVKDSIALNFMIEVLNVVKAEKGSASVLNLLKKSGLDSMLTELFPTNKRGSEGMKNHFVTAGLPEIVTYLSSIENAGAKKELQRNLRNSIVEGQGIKEMVADLRDSVKKHGLSEPEAASMIWAAVMSAIEWNKKEDLLMEQALKHLKEYIPLFKVFTTNAKSELVLCNKVQEYCYDNQNFLKCFNKIILLFYKTEVLSEEVILKWYKDAHAPKGWTVFMDQMKKFVEWLEQAESESEEDSDEED